MPSVKEIVEPFQLPLEEGNALSIDPERFGELVVEYLQSIGYQNLNRELQTTVSTIIYQIAGGRLKETAMVAIQSIVGRS